MIGFQKISEVLELVMVAVGQTYLQADRVWEIWCWRNLHVFKGEDICLERKIKWLREAKIMVDKAFEMILHFRFEGSKEVHLKWISPDEGWPVINADGNLVHGAGVAGYGGLLRDK